MSNRKNENFTNLFKSFFSDKDLYESFYNKITNKLTPTLGETKTESGTNEDGTKWYKTTFTSHDGSYTSTSYVSSTNYDNYWYPTSTNDIKTTPELSQLKTALNKAVDTQNFEEAVKLRDLIQSYEKDSEKLKELKYKLQNAIENQEFELAIELRDSIKKLESK